MDVQVPRSTGLLFMFTKGWGHNKSAFLAIILLAMHALTQQGERRANSWLFNRRTTQRSERMDAQKCDFIKSPALSRNANLRGDNVGS